MQGHRASYGFYSVQSPSSTRNSSWGEVFSGSANDDGASLLKYERHSDKGADVTSTGLGAKLTSRREGYDVGTDGRVRSRRDVSGEALFKGNHDKSISSPGEALQSSGSWHSADRVAQRRSTGDDGYPLGRSHAHAESWWSDDAERTLSEGTPTYSGSNVELATEVYDVNSADREYRLTSADGHHGLNDIDPSRGCDNADDHSIHLAIPCRVVEEDEDSEAEVSPSQVLSAGSYPYSTKGHMWQKYRSPHDNDNGTRSIKQDSQIESHVLSPSGLNDPATTRRSTETASLSYVWTPPDDITWDQRPRYSTESASNTMGSFDSDRRELGLNGKAAIGSKGPRVSTPDGYFRFIYGGDSISDKPDVIERVEGIYDPVPRYASRNNFQAEWQVLADEGKGQSKTQGDANDHTFISREKNVHTQSRGQKLSKERNESGFQVNAHSVYYNQGYEHTSTDSVSGRNQCDEYSRITHARQAQELSQPNDSQTSTLDSVFSERSWSSDRGRPRVFRERRRVFPRPRDPLGDAGDGLKSKRNNDAYTNKVNPPVKERLQRRSHGPRDMQSVLNDPLRNGRHGSHGGDLPKSLIMRELRMYMTREEAKRGDRPSSNYQLENESSNRNHRPIGDPRHKSYYLGRTAPSQLPSQMSGTLDRHYRRVMQGRYPQRLNQNVARAGKIEPRKEKYKDEVMDSKARTITHYRNDVNKPLSSHNGYREEKSSRGRQLRDLEKQSFIPNRSPDRKEVPTVSGKLGHRDQGHRREIRGRSGGRRGIQTYASEGQGHQQHHMQSRTSGKASALESKSDRFPSNHKSEQFSEARKPMDLVRYTGSEQPTPATFNESHHGPRKSNNSEKAPERLSTTIVDRNHSTKPPNSHHTLGPKASQLHKKSSFSNWRCLSTLAAIWFCPIGIWALRKSKQVDARVKAGDIAGAKRASRSARNHAIVAFLALAIIVLILIARLIEVSVDPEKTFIQNTQQGTSNQNI